MKGIAVFIFFFALVSCSQGLRNQKIQSGIRIDIDSVFINVYEKGRAFNHPMVFFYYDFHNLSPDTLRISLRRYPFEPIGLDKAYSVFKMDTVELFAGMFTRSVNLIPPYTSKRLDLNIESDDLSEIYIRDQFMYGSEQNFLRQIAENAINHFIVNSRLIIDRPGDRKIVFRDPNDDLEEMWK